MQPPSGLPFAAALLTQGSPASNGRAPGDTGAPEMISHLTSDHDQIAQRLNDVVVHRIFAAGLDLHGALGLISDQAAASKIYHAIDELDQAIMGIRESIFGPGPRDPQPGRRPRPVEAA